MAEEKKPKIDLKTRLQKMGHAGAGAGQVAAIPAARGSGPTPMPPPAIPVPPGVVPPPSFGSSPPPLDPNNPLAAVARPFTGPPPAASAPAAPATIQVDEGHVHEARRGVRNIMIVVAVGVGVVGGILGYIGGKGAQSASTRSASADDAHQLAKDLGNAKSQLSQLAAKMSDGQKSLAAGKFPDGLEKDLNSITVDFDGKKLGNKSFAGISVDTSKDLVDFVAGVAALEKKKGAIRAVLVTQQKGIQDLLAANAAKDKTTFNYIVTIDRDSLNGNARVLALAKPLTVANNQDLPAKLPMPTKDPNKSVDVDRFTGTELKPDSHFAMLLDPGAPAALCGGNDPSNVLRQLQTDMQTFINDIIAQSNPDAIGEQKVGLADRADKLIDTLSHIR